MMDRHQHRGTLNYLLAISKADCTVNVSIVSDSGAASHMFMPTSAGLARSGVPDVVDYSSIGHSESPAVGRHTATTRRLCRRSEL